MKSTHNICEYCTSVVLLFESLLTTCMPALLAMTIIKLKPLNYTYFDNSQGSKIRVWLQEFINGNHRVVSNPIEYEVLQSEFTLAVDQLFKLRRNGQKGDPVQWVIEKERDIALFRSATTELTYTYSRNVLG